MADSLPNYRSPILNESALNSGSNVMRTPFGNIRSRGYQGPPPLPPPVHSQSTYGVGYGTGGAAVGMGYSSLYGGGAYGLGLGNYGYNGYNGFGYGGGGYTSAYGGFGGGYGSYNRFGGSSYMNPNDPENQFIQIAEESSRPAFQSIESLVAAIGNIASMLDSTFFAITSTFRAILGVTANFGRLRGVFAQFWQTFAIFKGLTWIYKKLLYLLRFSNVDPAKVALKEAFAAAETAAGMTGPHLPKVAKGQSAWPVLAFLGFIFTAPYLIMKLLGDITKSAIEESRNPKTWVRPIASQVMYNFQGRNPSELTIHIGQTVFVAPKEVQNTHKLLNSGWALATLDGQTSGLIPISYVQGPNQMKRNQPNNTQNFEEFPVPTLTADNVVKVSTDQIVNVDPPIADAVTESKQKSNDPTSKIVLPVIPEANEIEDPI